MKRMIKRSIMPLSASLLLALLLVSPALAQETAQAGSENGALFAAPVLLMAGGEPMGKSRIYPSPVMFDLDGDKIPEMVIGELTGRMWFAKKLPGNDPAAWSELQPLNSADGKQLKFSNW